MIAGELRAKLLRQLRGQAGLQGNAPATHQYTRRRRCGGRRRDRRAWLRCPWAAGPGRTTSQRTEPHASTPGPTGMEGAGGICRGAGGRWRGLAGLRGDAPSEARGADGSRAGRRPRAHKAARPANTPHGARNTSGATSNNTRRGQLAGGRAHRRPEHQRRNTPLRHNKTAQPHRGRAAQTISERGSAQDHDDVRITETAFLTDVRNAKL